MHDFSLLEGKHPSRRDTESRIVFGRVTKVYPERRTCEVKTFGAPGSFSDNHIPECQWLSSDAHIDGDESGSTPKVNSFCLVAMVDGEPFILGFFRPLNKTSGAVSGEELVPLNLGDKMIATASGNRIVAKSNGLIEIHCKNTLKRIYFPPTSEIRDLCRNYKLHADGGLVHWENDGLGQTVHREEFRADLAKTSVVVEERGSVDGLIVKRVLMGVGTGAAPFEVPLPQYDFSLDRTGKTSLKIGPPGAPIFEEAISPLGDWSRKNKAAEVSVSPTGDVAVKNLVASVEVSAAGAIDVKNKIGSLSISPTGEITVKTGATTITATATGDLKIDASKATLSMGKGKVALGGPAAEIFATLGKFFEQFDTLLTAMAAEVHTGNLGYPTSPPMNAAQYLAVQVQVKTLAALLKTVTN